MFSRQTPARLGFACRTYAMGTWAILAFLGTVDLHAADAPPADPLAPARAALRAGRFLPPIELLQQAAESAASHADERTYLLAVARMHAGEFDGAIEAARELLEKHPQSVWGAKARFLQAQAHAALRQFPEAEKLYEVEAAHLLSQERKQEVAGVLIEFADALATPPDPNDVGAPPADYAKADELYAQALAMEIGRDLRDDLGYKRAQAKARAENHAGVVADSEGYLLEFDPLWVQSASGTASRALDKRMAPPPAGRHRLAMRRLLVAALLSQGLFDQARFEAENLVALFARRAPGVAGAEEGGPPKSAAETPDPTPDPAQEPNEQLADAQWLLVRTYQLPTPPADQLDKGVQVARQFIHDHASHARAVQAARWIPETYAVHGRTEEAIAAWKKFLAGEGFALPSGDAAHAKLVDTGQSPAEMLLQGEQLALYSIGQLLYSQRKYEDAKQTWNRYIQQHPNGPQWEECQRGVVTAEFQEAIDAIAAKNYDQARNLLERFLAAHPLEPRAPQAMFLLGQMDYAAAEAAETQKAPTAKQADRWRQTIDRWQRLVSKHPQSEEASLALYRIGLIYEEKLRDLPQALAAYRRLTWGSAVQAARARIAAMTEKHLAVVIERSYRTNEPAQLRVSTRNIKKLTLKQYSLDMEAYFRKTHDSDDIESLDVDLIQPDKTWEIDVQNFAEYAPLSQSIDVPFPVDQAGVCLVSVSGDDLEASALVVRSDLDLIVKSSRRELLVFAEDRLRQTPAEGVELLVSDGREVFAVGATNADGVFHRQFDKLRDAENVRVFAKRKGSVASHLVDLSSLALSAGLTPKGYLITDRPAYQPGETVRFRGILRDVVNGAYALPAKKTCQASISDEGGTLLWQNDVTLNEFGSFHAEFPLDENASDGKYALSVRRDDATLFTSHFQVERFQLQKMKLSLSTDRAVYYRGEKVELTVDAAYYWGQPVADAPLSVTLPDGRTQRETTDAKGRVVVRFDTSDLRAGVPLRFGASLDGEQVAAAHAAVLATLGFRLSVKPSRDLIIAGEPLETAITCLAADGKPLAVPLTLTVLRKSEPKSDPVLEQVPWIERRPQSVAETIVVERPLATDEKTGRAVVALPGETFTHGGTYVLRVAGTDRFAQMVTGQAELRVSADDDVSELRFFSEVDTLQVGKPAALRIHARADAPLALLTVDGETILDYRIVKLTKGYNPLELVVRHDYFPNVRVTINMIDGQQLLSAAKPFQVERQLHVELEPQAPAYRPGETAVFGLRVTDHLGNPVRGEFSLALVNEALFALYPDELPSIVDYFQAGVVRTAEFRQASTCGFRYEAAARRVLPEFQEEEQRLAWADKESRMLRENGNAATYDMLIGQVPTAGPRSTPRFSAQGMGGFGGGEQKPSNEEAEAIAGSLAKKLRQRDEADKSSPAQPANETDFPSFAADLDSLTNLIVTTVDSESFATSQRQDLPQASWWEPAVVTDEQGRAGFEIPLPTSASQWRLTARGATVDTLVGQATSQTLTRHDFFVTLKTPPFAREGDQLRILARVHNLSDFAGDVQLKLSIADEGSPGKALATRNKTARIEPQGSVDVVFDAWDAPPLSRLNIAVHAQAGERVDEVATRLDVIPWGLEWSDEDGGVAQRDVASYVELPKNRPYQSRWMTVWVGPSLHQSVIDMALADGRFPVPLSSKSEQPLRGALRCLPPGVWERTPASDLLAVAVALEYAERAQAAPADRELLLERARRLASSLVIAQREDGGWSWQSDGKQSDWGVSAMAFWALAATADRGVKIHDDALPKAQAYLENQLTQLGQNDDEPKAVILHALSLRKAADFAHVNRLYRLRQNLSQPALAYAALTLANLGRNDFAVDVLDALATKAQSVGEKIYWHGSSQTPWLGDSIETTAIAALAMMKAQPTSPHIQKAVDYLLERRGVWGFVPAKSHGPAIAALCAFYQQGDHAGDDYTLAIEVNGKPLAQLTGRAAPRPQQWNVPVDLLAPGRNQVDFRLQGRGKFAYAVSLCGFSSDMTPPRDQDADQWLPSQVYERSYRHAEQTYRQRPIGVPSTSPVEHLEHGQRVRVDVNFHRVRHAPIYTVVEEPLPAGTTYVDGSLTGAFQHVDVRHDRLVLHYRPGDLVGNFSYEVAAYAPGVYRAAPTVVRDALRPGRMHIGKTGALTVLAPSEKSDDPYEWNVAEQYALGKLLFDDGLLQEAAPKLQYLFREHRGYQEQEVARMLLWIYASPKLYDARQIVDAFEVLRERYPTLEIPYDKILRVGTAYRDTNEYERALQIFRATIDASFVNDSNVSAVLEDNGQYLRSIEYQTELWRQYPDSDDVIASYFALSQSLCQQAPEAHVLAQSQRRLAQERGAEPPRKLEKIPMLQHAIELLSQFMTLYPTSPLSDDAAFSLSNALLDLKQYPLVVDACRQYHERFSDSEFRHGFQYMTALGYFWQRLHEEAIRAATPVADGESKDRDLARYIIGQIYHAQNKPLEAIEWYRKVVQQFPDAQQAIDYFERRSVELDEINVYRPGEPLKLDVRHRNVAELRCQVYRVDLMRLYLREKNLANVTQVNLAGIAPLVEKSVSLGDGKNYAERTTELGLELPEEGAYLAICRGDDLFTSALVLVTPLKIEVQQESSSGAIRANVIDAATGMYAAEVHVKAIGSADSAFHDGETDLRGVFSADGLRGKATIIARQGAARYAFYRGDQWLGAPENAQQAMDGNAPQQRGQPMAGQPAMLDYGQNVRKMNLKIQSGNYLQFDQLRRGKNSGVQVQKAQ